MDVLYKFGNIRNIKVKSLKQPSIFKFIMKIVIEIVLIIN